MVVHKSKVDAMRTFVSTSSLTVAALGLAMAAVGVLFTFPENPLVWNVATWTLVAALAGLLVLVLVSGYVLATERAARTWQRTASFLAGVACLGAIAVASL